MALLYRRIRLQVGRIPPQQPVPAVGIWLWWHRRSQRLAKTIHPKSTPIYMNKEFSPPGFFPNAMSKLESKRDVESESLLPGEDVGRYRVPRSSKNYFFSRKSAVIHFLIFISYIAASTVAIVLFQSRRPWDLVYCRAILLILHI